MPRSSQKFVPPDDDWFSDIPDEPDFEIDAEVQEEITPPVIRNGTAKSNGRKAKSEGGNKLVSEFTGELMPREKLQAQGSAALTDAELLAILLRVGIKGENVLELSRRLLRDYGGLTGLSRVPFDEMATIRGVGEAKAATLKAALEIGRRLLIAQPDDRPQVRSPKDVADMLMLEMSALEQEVLKLVMLNTKNQIVRIANAYQGTINSSQVRIAELFREAIRANATSIILVHNHPSGDPTPSPEDVRLTGEVVQAGKLLDVHLLDHLIIGHQRFTSLREQRQGFSD